MVKNNDVLRIDLPDCIRERKSLSLILFWSWERFLAPQIQFLAAAHVLHQQSTDRRVRDLCAKFDLAECYAIHTCIVFHRVLQQKFITPHPHTVCQRTPVAQLLRAYTILLVVLRCLERRSRSLGSFISLSPAIPVLLLRKRCWSCARTLLSHETSPSYYVERVEVHGFFISRSDR